MGDRDWWLREIFRHEEISYDPRTLNTKDLRDYLKKKWGKAPANIGTIDALEAIAFALGHPEGVERELRVPKEKPRDRIKSADHLIKRKITIEEMIRLREEGKSYRAIGEAAGISRTRARELINSQLCATAQPIAVPSSAPE